MNTKETAMLSSLGPCAEGMEFATGAKSLKNAWDTCVRPDWMLWALYRIGYGNDKVLRLYACACVRGTPIPGGRTVWDLLTDDRSRKAVEVSERFAQGEASMSELAATWDAARYAARAAAWYAAWDAARDAAWYAARDAAWDAARDAAWYAARAAAWDAAWDAARAWQANTLRSMVPWSDVHKAIKACASWKKAIKACASWKKA
jgi:hypothetical protein